MTMARRNVNNRNRSTNVSNSMKGNHHETECSTTTGSQDFDSSSIDIELTWMFSYTNYHANHAIV
jgi:hypothetical protein